MNAKTFRSSLLIAASLCARLAMAGASDSTIVADFDAQTNKNNIDGFWFYVDDKGSGGNSKVTSGDTTVNPVIFSQASFGDDPNSILGYSGKLGFTFGTTRPSCGGTCTYSPEVTLGTNMVPSGLAAADLSGATSISFDAKGDVPLTISLIFITTDITDYSWARAYVKTSATWQHFTVNLTGATAPVFKATYGQGLANKTLTLSKTQGISFALQKDSNATVTSSALYLDNLVVHGWKDQYVSAIRDTHTSLTKALQAAIDGKSMKVSVPSAYRNVEGTVAALDLAGKTVASAPFAKGQESVSITLNSRPSSPVFLRVFAGAAR